MNQNQKPTFVMTNLANPQPGSQYELFPDDRRVVGHCSCAWCFGFYVVCDQCGGFLRESAVRREVRGFVASALRGSSPGAQGAGSKGDI